MRAVFLAILAAFTGLPGLAQDVTRGGDLYLSFCSTCHGPEGRGDGRMGPILTVLPADLTGLSSANGGVFPVTLVASRIDGRDPYLAHGGPMPLFGNYFLGADAGLRLETGQTLMASQEIVDLIAFLETLQSEN